ncbi:MAG: hypothetical protein RL199_1617, partial [Pseudomonadota bacterium]
MVALEALQGARGRAQQFKPLNAPEKPN